MVTLASDAPVPLSPQSSAPLRVGRTRCREELTTAVQAASRPVQASRSLRPAQAWDPQTQPTPDLHSHTTRRPALTFINIFLFTDPSLYKTRDQ